MINFNTGKDRITGLLSLAIILLPISQSMSEIDKEIPTVRGTNVVSTNRIVIQKASELDEIFLKLLDPAVNEGAKIALLKSPRLAEDDRGNERWFPVLTNLINTAKYGGLKYHAMISLRRFGKSNISGDVARYLLEFGSDSTQNQDLRRLAMESLRGFKGGEVSRGLADIALKGSPLFREGDFKDIKLLITKLRDAKDPASLYLWERFPAPAKQKLKQYNDALPVDKSIQNALINELNQIILGDNIYDVDSFRQVALSKRTQKLILFRRQLERDSLVCLNRYLIEEAYPHEITDLKSEDQSLRLKSICALQYVDNKLYTTIMKEIETSEPSLFVLVKEANQDTPKSVERRTKPKLLTHEQENDLRAKLESGNEKVSFSAIQALSNGTESDTIEKLMLYYEGASIKTKGEIALSLSKIAKHQPAQRELIGEFLKRAKNEETNELLCCVIEKFIGDVPKPTTNQTVAGVQQIPGSGKTNEEGTGADLPP